MIKTTPTPAQDPCITKFYDDFYAGTEGTDRKLVSLGDGGFLNKGSLNILLLKKIVDKQPLESICEETSS